MSFLFDNMFKKQNPELAGQMAQRGLIFDKNKRRWVKAPQQTGSPQEFRQALEQRGLMPRDNAPKENVKEKKAPKTKPKKVNILSNKQDELAKKAFTAKELPDFNINELSKHPYKDERMDEITFGNKSFMMNLWDDYQTDKREWDDDADQYGEEREYDGYASSEWNWDEDPEKRYLTDGDVHILQRLTDINNHSQHTAFLARRIGEPQMAWQMEKFNALHIVGGGISSKQLNSKEFRQMELIERTVRSLAVDRLHNEDEIHETTYKDYQD